MSRQFKFLVISHSLDVVPDDGSAYLGFQCTVIHIYIIFIFIRIIEFMKSIYCKSFFI